MLSLSRRLQPVYLIKLNHSMKMFSLSKELNPNLTAIEHEKQMFKLKRDVSSQYSKGNYTKALECAESLEKYVNDTMGKNNAVYASCLNNIALMHKMLGSYEIALNMYIDALHKYEDIVGKKNPSYVSTLTNIGVLCKQFAEATKGTEKKELQDRASEALTDAIKLRIELAGSDSRDCLHAKNQLASLQRAQGKYKDAEAIFRDVLDTSKRLYGDRDLLTAVTLNHLGLCLKHAGQFPEAKQMYEEALGIQSESIGESHPDTIITMHNLAELLHSTGSTEEALELQREIVRIVEAKEELSGTVASASSVTNTHSKNVLSPPSSKFSETKEEWKPN